MISLLRADMILDLTGLRKSGEGDLSTFRTWQDKFHSTGLFLLGNIRQLAIGINAKKQAEK